MSIKPKKKKKTRQTRKYENNSNSHVILVTYLTSNATLSWMQHPIALSVARHKNRRSLIRSIFFPKIDDSHYDRIHSSLTDAHCFANGYVESSGLERIVCGVLRLKVKGTPGNRG